MTYDLFKALAYLPEYDQFIQNIQDRRLTEDKTNKYKDLKPE